MIVVIDPLTLSYVEELLLLYACRLSHILDAEVLPDHPSHHAWKAGLCHELVCSDHLLLVFIDRII